MNKAAKTLVFWMVIVIAGTLLWLAVRNTNSQAQHTPEISYSEFLSQANAGNVARVRIDRVVVNGSYRNGGSFRVIVPPDQGELLALLQQKDTEIWFLDMNDQSSWNWLVNLAPLILLAALWYWMIRGLRAKAKPQSLGNPGLTPPSGM